MTRAELALPGARALYLRQWRAARSQESTERERKWAREWARRKRQTPGGRAAFKEARRRYTRKHREKIALYQQQKMRRRRTNYRAEAFRHYGAVCACCGETEMAFLTFDHIDGGGNQERKRGLTNTIEMLRKLNYPTTIQVLCANCNMAKHIRGVCPHRESAINVIRDTGATANPTISCSTVSQ